SIQRNGCGGRDLGHIHRDDHLSRLEHLGNHYGDVWRGGSTGISQRDSSVFGRADRRPNLRMHLPTGKLSGNVVEPQRVSERRKSHVHGYGEWNHVYQWNRVERQSDLHVRWVSKDQRISTVLFWRRNSDRGAQRVAAVDATSGKWFEQHGNSVGHIDGDRSSIPGWRDLRDVFGSSKWQLFRVAYTTCRGSGRSCGNCRRRGQNRFFCCFALPSCSCSFFCRASSGSPTITIFRK